jgi:hypothetical protein
MLVSTPHLPTAAILWKHRVVVATATRTMMLCDLTAALTMIHDVMVVYDVIKIVALARADDVTVQCRCWEEDGGVEYRHNSTFFFFFETINLLKTAEIQGG